MLQEDQTVSFQPIYEGYQPWFAKLFAFYLFIVLIVLFVRSVKFIWILLKLRKPDADSESVSNIVWADSSGRTASSGRLACLTVLISVLVLSWWTADVLLGVRAEKTPNLAYILPAIGDALTAFTLGIIVAVAALGWFNVGTIYA
jgi:hypothetical protein